MKSKLSDATWMIHDRSKTLKLIEQKNNETISVWTRQDVKQDAGNEQEKKRKKERKKNDEKKQYSQNLRRLKTTIH